MAVHRYDSATISKAVKLDNGWLRAPALLTRTGIFEYLQDDGSIRRELRPPDEVFAPEAVQSFEAVPIVIRHPYGKTPEGLLDENTARDLSVGAVGAPRQDGDYLAANVLLTDAEGVRVVESGMQELSLGYRCDTDETPGVWKGKPYDAVQRNIRGNHLAIVDRARAGSEVRIRLDSGDAVHVVSHIEQTPPASDQPSEPHNMATKQIKIDGVDFEVSDQAAQAVDKLKKRHDERLEEATKATAEIKAAGSKAEARADAAEAKAKELEGKLAAATDPKAMQAKIAERVSLETQARDILGADVKLDGLDEDGIKRAVLSKTTPDVKLDGKDAAYVAAAFDFAVASGTKKTRAPVVERFDAGDSRNDGAPVDLNKARAAYEQKLRDAHKPAAK